MSSVDRGSVGHCPFVSVIIPTYNRAEMLGLTIESLIAQTYPDERYEIIVVDNNSTDGTRQVVRDWHARSGPPLRYLFEGRQGVHYARNSAARVSRGDMLYYTDDDMLADSRLLEEIVKPFNYDPKVASVTGSVLPKWEQPPPQWVLDYCLNGYLSLLDRPEHLLISPYDCGVYSCHQAVRRDVFFQAGGFNPENTAGEWIGDGETGLNIKIKDLGFRFAYIRSSVTYHMIPTSRMTQGYLNKRLANQGNCDSYTDYRKHTYTRRQLSRRIVAHAKNVVAQSLKYAIKRLLGRPSWRLNRARVDYYRNRIRYDRRLIKDEGWRRLVLKSDWLSNTDEPEGLCNVSKLEMPST